MDENNSYDAFENLFIGKKRYVNLTIVAVNILVYIFVEFFTNDEIFMYIYDRGAAVTPLILNGEYYRLFSSMFLHAGISHLFGNMLMILFVGDELEEITGHIKYFVIAIVGGLTGNIATLCFDIVNHKSVPSIGASGIAYAILGGIMACIIKKCLKRKLSIKKLVIITALTLISDFNTANINAIAHLGGLVGGFILASLLV